MPASTPFEKPVPVSAPHAETSAGAVPTLIAVPVDESVSNWYDSSFDLRRGLWVIETDLDPAITHGIVTRKRTHLGKA